MNQLNAKNIIKYFTLSGCLLNTNHLCGALHWKNFGLGNIDLNTVNVNTPDKWGDMLLHVAARYGQVGTIGVLLDRSAEVDARNRYGETPLHVAAGRGHVGAIRALLAGGADRNAQNEYGETPLHVAVKCDQVKAIRALIVEDV
ncbi:MAG: ankyrin repeat domain-containing protein, partial [Holosporaceae bacterium]|nr:ankyrin repeat domain-containing protein [Holosporaceae bacterium]